MDLPQSEDTARPFERLGPLIIHHSNTPLLQNSTTPSPTTNRDLALQPHSTESLEKVAQRRVVRGDGFRFGLAHLNVLDGDAVGR